MKDKKRRLETYSLYDHTGLEAHLAGMAAQGWLLEKIGKFLWTYRKIEPKSLAFCVCYYDKASQFDPEPSEEQQTFYDFCQYTGWTLAAASVQLQVFYNEQPDPVPIETDPVMEVDAIHRTMKKTFVLSQFSLLALVVMQAGMAVWRFMDNPITALCDPAQLFLCLLWPLMLLIAGTELGSYYAWRRRALKAAAQGEFLETKSHPVFQKAALAVLLVMFGCFMVYILTSGSHVLVSGVLFGVVHVALMLSVLYGVKGFLRRKKISADTNRMVTFGAYFLIFFLILALVPIFVFTAGQSDAAESPLSRNELPLTLYDLVEAAGSGEIRQSSWSTQSPLAGSLDVHQYLPPDGTDASGSCGLRYTVVEVKLPTLYDFAKNGMLRRRDTRNRDWDYRRWYEPIDPAPWGAAEAYREYGQYFDPSGGSYVDQKDRYLLCYPYRIMEIDLDWEPTQEQMAQVAKKLGGV